MLNQLSKPAGGAIDNGGRYLVYFVISWLSIAQNYLNTVKPSGLGLELALG